MTSTTGPFTAADAARHEPAPGVERWQETAMISWYDARTRCGGYHHIDLQPGPDRSCLWSWTAVDGVVAGKFQSLNLPLRPGSDVVDPPVGPVRLRTVEPYAWYDLAVTHPGGAEESVAFETATPVLHHAMPGDDAGPDAPERAHRGAADYSSSGTGHYEMLGRVRGTVSDGRGGTREVDGWGFHDHSWGPRTYGGLTATHRWVHMAFGPDLQASLYSIGTDTDRRVYGFLVRDGWVSRVADVEVEVTIATDGHTPRRCAGVLRDTVGRAYSFSGEMHVASVSTHDGGYFVTDAYGEFRMGDRVGSGLLAVRERATPSAEHRRVLAEHDT
jgi:hypothetical protein